MHTTRLLPFVAASFLACGISLAQTTVNVACDKDNSLYFDPAGSISNGLGSSLFVGATSGGRVRRAVLHFDVAAAVPAGAKIVSATLTLNVVQTTAFLPVLADVHRLTGSFGEGASLGGGPHGGSGVAAATNDATWIHRFYPSTLWTNPGGDFAAAASFQVSMPAFGLTTMTPSMSGTADVQSWLDNPAQNFGWLLKAHDEALFSTAHRLDSRNGGSVPPALQVTYLLPGQDGVYGVGCPVGAGTSTTAFVGVPTGGTNLTISQTQTVPNSLGANYFSLALDPAGAPLGIPGCTVYLPLALPIIPGDVFLTSAGGSASSLLALPVGFPGYLITCQSAVLAGNPLGFVLGNAALTVLQ